MKFKLLFFLFFLFFFSTRASAQDTIFFKNGTFKIVKVTEVGEKSITYFKLESLEGAPYTISSGNVSSISFSNGKKVIIAPLDKYSVVKRSAVDSARTAQDSIKQAKFNNRKFALTLNLMHYLFLNGNINVNYFPKNKRCSFYFPLEVGIAASERVPGEVMMTKKAFTLGVGLKIHYYKTRRSSGHVMPLVEVGKVYFQHPVAPKNSKNKTIDMANAFVATLNLGQDTYVGSHFFFGMNAGTGVRLQKTNITTNYTSASYTFSYEAIPSIKLGLHLGYWF
jgi:hypothetical protein